MTQKRILDKQGRTCGFIDIGNRNVLGAYDSTGGFIGSYHKSSDQTMSVDLGFMGRGDQRGILIGLTQK